MLIRNTVAFLPAQILSPAAQLISVIAWTHLANEKMIGVVTLATATQDLLATVGLSWWNLYAVRAYLEHRAAGKAAEFSGASLLVVGVSSVLQACLSAANLLAFVDQKASAALCVVVALYTALRSVNMFNDTIEAVRIRPFDYTVYALCGPVLGLILGVAALAAFGSDPIWPLLGYALGEGVGVLYALLKRRESVASFKNIKPIIAEAVRYGGPLVLAGGISWISVNLPRYAVNGIMGIEAAGLFSVGFGLGQRASMVAAMAVTVAALPLAVKRNTEGGREAALDQLAQNIALLMAIMAPALVGLWLVSPSLVHLAIGQPYWEATLSLLPWSMLSGAVGAFASNYLNHVFLLDRQTWRLFGIEVATTAATAILAFWLTHTHGLVGAVWAILGPRAAMTAILTIWLVWRGRLVVPVNHFAITAVATATMAGAVLAVPAHDTIVSLVAKIAIGALAYISCLAFFYRDWVGEKLRRAA